MNPLSLAPENWQIWMDYDEEILSVEPFEARFTFTIGENALTLTVDDTLNVVEATTNGESETAV